MKARAIVVVFTVTLALLVGLVGPAAAAAGGEGPVRLIVVFDQPTPGTKVNEAVVGYLDEYGGQLLTEFTLVPGMVVLIPDRAVSGLKAIPGVREVGIDGRVYAIDAELDDSWGVKHIGAGTVHAYNKGTGVKVGIIDSGVDYTHSDLNDNYIGGYDFVNSDSDPMDDNGHGTHVAGIAAAEDDGAGVVGVAPEGYIYALKVLDESGSGYWSDIIAALEWSVDPNGDGDTSDRMDVVNLSLGASRDAPGVRDAFKAAYNAGIVLVAAAGNSGNPGGKSNTVEYPARYDEVIAVGATDQNDTRPSWSSHGDQLELAAPGVDVKSTYLGGYAYGSGTSMASPHVAGTAVLVLANGTLTDLNSDGAIDNQDVRLLLQQTADDLGPIGKDSEYGYGLVNADEAAPPSAGVPSVSITSPADGSTFHVNESILFEGTATDPEDGDVTASLVWTSSIDGQTGTGGSFSATLSEGQHTITASATDSEGNQGSASIGVTIVNDAPVVTILQPVDGASFDSGTRITFEGTASDTEDGDVTAGLVWRSSIDGQIGTGGSFSIILSDGNHTISAKATDSNGKIGSSSISITVGAPSEPTTVSVSSITYATQGGKNNDRHLLITLALVDDLGNPVPSASVSIDVYRNTALYGSETGMTETDGTVTFKLTNAPSGSYTTTVTDVTAEGLTWDGTTPENSFSK